jgi:hypothetical protein
MFHFLSGLAYLAICLLLAAPGAWKKYPRDGHRTSPAKEPSTGENSGRGAAFSFTAHPFRSSASCLLSLSSFLFMPCGAFPALCSVSGSAPVAAGLLVAASGLCGGWKQACAQGIAPLGLGVSLAAMAHYARQRGVPGDLYTLDAYVAMPLAGVADGAAIPGIWILAGVSLWVLWLASPARRIAAFAQKSPEGDEAFLAALSAEIWILALIGFWVCLFFPFSFAHAPVSGIPIPVALAVDALLFWCKILGLKWLLGQGEAPCGGAVHGSILFALWGMGIWLLLDASVS